MFASNFWLWSIIGLLGFMLLYTLGALMNMIGFLTPLRKVTSALDNAPGAVKFAVVAGAFGLLAYPSLAHKLWADATATEIRWAFDRLPTFPGASQAPLIEQMAGLYDPTSTDGIYVIGWFGTTAPFDDVRAFYVAALEGRSWAMQPVAGQGQARRGLPSNRLTFRDNSVASRASYDLVLAQLPPTAEDVPAEVRALPTVFALRLGVVDPRLTTQVAWFIDCLVRLAPTFPSCEALGWNPIEAALGR